MKKKCRHKYEACPTCNATKHCTVCGRSIAWTRLDYAKLEAGMLKITEHS